MIDDVLIAEQRNGATLTLGDALAELLQDISDAARTIGMILRPTTTSGTPLTDRTALGRRESEDRAKHTSPIKHSRIMCRS